MNKPMLKGRRALLAAIAAGMIGVAAAPVQALPLDSGGGGGDAVATSDVHKVRTVDCSSIPAQIRGLDETSCH